MLSNFFSYPKIDRGRPLQRSGKTMNFGDFVKSDIFKHTFLRKVHHTTSWIDRSDLMYNTSFADPSERFFLELNISPFCGRRPQSFDLYHFFMFEVVYLVNKEKIGNSTLNDLKCVYNWNKLYCIYQYLAVTYFGIMCPIY